MEAAQAQVPASDAAGTTERLLQSMTTSSEQASDRSTKLCMAGIDVEGVSVAGQVRACMHAAKAVVYWRDADCLH